MVVVASVNISLDDDEEADDDDEPEELLLIRLLEFILPMAFVWSSSASITEVLATNVAVAVVEVFAVVKCIFARLVVEDLASLFSLSESSPCMAAVVDELTEDEVEDDTVADCIVAEL